MRARWCKRCFVNLGTFAEWVNGSPYCVEHAKDKIAEIEARREPAPTVVVTVGSPELKWDGTDGCLNGYADVTEEATEDEDPTAGFLYERFWR